MSVRDVVCVCEECGVCEESGVWGVCEGCGVCMRDVCVRDVVYMMDVGCV